jgi:hypothetical protein
MKPLAAAMAALLPLAAQAADVADTRKTLNVVFPRDVEISLALQGGPAHLREGATVYVYGAKGYEKAKDGTNGFTCFVNRDGFFYGVENFKPTCWDAEGKTSYVPVMLRVGELLAAGNSTDDIRADIDGGFKDGRFKRPARSGVAYMTAGDVRLDGSGKVTATAFPGHMMFYAPGVTSADLGYTPEAGKKDPTLPFVFDRGAGGTNLAYIIAVPHR